jgi:hypothetical protein
VREYEGHTLFTEALRVMSEALTAHKDASPYREMLARAGRILGGQDLWVAIYEKSPGAPVDHYTIRMDGAKFHVVAHGKQEPAADWTVSVDYLRRVAGNPQAYIDVPARLDLGWLERRLGLSR